MISKALKAMVRSGFIVWARGGCFLSIFFVRVSNGKVGTENGDFDPEGPSYDMITDGAREQLGVGDWPCRFAE